MKTSEALITIAETIVITLGIFVAYQILRKVLGGSWASEDIMTTVLTLNATATFAMFALVVSMTRSIARFNSDTKYLTKDIRELRIDLRELKTDFKNYTEKLNDLSTDLKLHLKEHKADN